MSNFSRRSFVIASGLGALALAGCSGSKDGDSKSGSADKAKNVKSNGQPFQVIDFKYRETGTENSYSISYSVRNNLTDKAILLAPLTIKGLDASGKELEDLGYQKRTLTDVINPGEVAYFENSYNPGDNPKVEKIVLEGDYSAKEENYYYTDDPIPGNLYKVEQEADPVTSDDSVQVRVKVTPTDAYRSSERFKNLKRVNITAIFYNDKGEMVQVLQDSSPLDSPDATVHGFLQFFGKLEFSKVEFHAVPDIDVNLDKRAHFS